MKRVIVAMSGGVDSSVAAWLLKEQGYQVVGVFLRTGVTHDAVPKASAERSRGCCSAIDASDARTVAAHLDIPFYSLDFAEEFGGLMDHFADSYLKGRTPNPCVECNSKVKFGRLWDMTRQLEGDYLATGHYAKALVNEDGSVSLARAADTSKDQTYVLFGVNQKVLQKVLFPLGGYTKEQVREIARKAGIITAEKPESMDLCFVPDGNAADFVKRRRPGASKAGELVDTSGNVLANHEGIEHFTIGQRKNLGIDRSLNQGKRRFVLELVPDQSKVIVGDEEECKVTEIVVANCNWIQHPPVEATLCQIKYSHAFPAVEGTIKVNSSGTITGQFHEPAFAVSPGQACVFYKQDVVIGGGWIETTIRNQA